MFLNYKTTYQNFKNQYLTSTVDKGTPTAAPAGETCLKLVAAGKFRALFNSFTNCQPFRASHKFMKPGEPFTTVSGSLERVVYSCAGF